MTKESSVSQPQSKFVTTYSVVIHVSNPHPQHYQKAFLSYTGHLRRKVSHSLDKSINVDLGFLPPWHMPIATILSILHRESVSGHRWFFLAVSSQEMSRDKDAGC